MGQPPRGNHKGCPYIGRQSVYGNGGWRGKGLPLRCVEVGRRLISAGASRFLGYARNDMVTVT